MGGLTSCSSTTSLACYSDKPGPPPLLIGATAAAALFRRHCSWGTCSCVAHGQPAPSQAHRMVIPGIFGSNLALLGDYPWPAWRAASKFEQPPMPLGLLKINQNPLCSPEVWRSRATTPRASLPLPTGRKETYAPAAIFRLCGPVAPWPGGPAALWGRESHRLAAGCCSPETPAWCAQDNHE